MPDSPFQDLLHDAWETQMRLDPLYATMCGERRYKFQVIVLVSGY
jgi:hypothetical protein